jgi:hypothetical protein
MLREELIAAVRHRGHRLTFVLIIPAEWNGSAGETR